MTNAFIAQVDAFVQAARTIPVVHLRQGTTQGRCRRRVSRTLSEDRRRPVPRQGPGEGHRLPHRETHQPATGKKYPWIVKSATPVNQFYFYCIDEDFGPFFLKFCTYFPYNAKLCINGHEYVKRQLAKEGIAFEALDNGILSCANPKRLQQLCDGLSAAKIDALLRKWLARLPHPFTAPGSQGRLPLRRVDPASRVLADPGSGSAADRPHLLRGSHPREPGPRPTRSGATDLRPARDASARRAAFARACLTDGVTPSLHVDYKNTRIKQYHKEGRALRTETTINNTRDFGIGKRLHNLPALREIGFQANRRLLDVQTTQPRLRDRRRRVPPGERTGGGRRSTGQRLAFRRS